MLILTRKPGESLYIGDDVKVFIVEIKGNQIRLGIEAPRDVRIYREEIYLQILEENKQAAEAAKAPELEQLEGLSQAWGSRKSPASNPLSSGAKFNAPKSSDSKNPEVSVKRKKRSKSDEW